MFLYGSFLWRDGNSGFYLLVVMVGLIPQTDEQTCAGDGVVVIVLTGSERSELIVGRGRDFHKNCPDFILCMKSGPKTD